MTRKEQIEDASEKCYYRNQAWAKESFIEGAEWADKHPQSPWISVSEELPPYRRDVICYNSLGNTYICARINLSELSEEKQERLRRYTDGNGFPNSGLKSKVLNWMPIPLLPKED